MNIIEVENYEELSIVGAEIISGRVKSQPHLTMGFATGGTPVGTYRELISDHSTKKTSYKNVTAFNLDEYLGLSGDHPNSYCHFMKEHLFQHIDIHSTSTFIPNGLAENPLEECRRYEELIEEKGGIDLQLLGIGFNGHIGFNEPYTSFSSRTHIVDLALSTRKANARYFNSIDDVPSQAVTMGIGTIMESREILLLISGAGKQAALSRLLDGDVNEEFPASALLSHSAVTIVADAAALGTRGRFS
ncbi:glucosamine-6-phosphate deaminase [Bacillus lacus]|uniref:Glucosamine-6-phosphate deaminase n=1 Tax=Metabacillus lacus TaxID=1983721 RepID=A0A7X2IYA7_9BACI|nr:glucosamine-6-phosphate deaminase [Metabacillus lacus]MRX71905.1 glucosamine-6-phosphate deaminase [Metabacillus lacus]